MPKNICDTVLRFFDAAPFRWPLLRSTDSLILRLVPEFLDPRVWSAREFFSGTIRQGFGPLRPEWPYSSRGFFKHTEPTSASCPTLRRCNLVKTEGRASMLLPSGSRTAQSHQMAAHPLEQHLDLRCLGSQGKGEVTRFPFRNFCLFFVHFLASILSLCVVIFFFPYNPHPPPHPDSPPARPTPQSLISVHFGSVSVRFGSVWLRFGSVSGLFRVCFGVLGGVGERGFCKGKEYH